MNIPWYVQNFKIALNRAYTISSKTEPGFFVKSRQRTPLQKQAIEMNKKYDSCWRQMVWFGLLGFMAYQPL